MSNCVIRKAYIVDHHRLVLLSGILEMRYICQFPFHSVSVCGIQSGHLLQAVARIHCLGIAKILRLSHDRQNYVPTRNLCSKKKTSSGNDIDVEIPEPPTTCCNSGCDSCVWIEYAEELLKNCKNGGDIAKAAILEKVEDPSMKAFLLAELKELEKENEKF